MSDDFMSGYFAGQDSNGGGGGFWGDGLWAIIILAMIGGWGNGGVFGGGGGYNGGFALQDLQNGIRGIERGMCDGFYAVNTTLLNGFAGVDRGFCDLAHTICNSTRDVIDNQNANTRQIMDFLVNSKIEELQDKNQNLRYENQTLRFRESQSEQNGILRAAIDASTAEIIRRTGNEPPTAAYIVPNPYCCYGNAGYGYGGYGGYGGGCGCGC